MKNIIALLAALLLTSRASVHSADGLKRTAAKPNIVFIFADDLGWKDVGYQGSDFMETPNIDRLAKEGMVFTAGYAAAGNCAPSRACLLSGTYTPRHHVFAVNSTDRGPKASQRLVPIPNKSGLAKENVTFADAMKAAGYVTGIFGKWHLDGPDGAAPAEQGFDVVHQSYGIHREEQGAPVSRLSPALCHPLGFAGAGVHAGALHGEAAWEAASRCALCCLHV
jgi:arylsulfatase A-like enzyme